MAGTDLPGAASGDEFDIIEFDDFTPAAPIAPREKDRSARRFMTLFVSERSARAVGSSGVVYRAKNVLGEQFALKRLRPSWDTPAGAAPDESRDAGRIEAFREEYRTQFALSNLPGFPQLFGYGTIGSWPAILMEWVEGETLTRARAELAVERDEQGRLRIPARAVAGIGVAALDALLLAGRAQRKLVHRDLSPNNIMLRTSARPIADQLLDGTFDVCLIDFGSATLVEPASARSFTVATSMWRGGTPEYAAPEMLTNDIAGVAALRSSASIDVYALCSVLYELYAGHTPFGIGQRGNESPYLIKTTQAPYPLVPRTEQDRPLVEALCAGIRPAQADRISAADLRRALERWLESAALIKPAADERAAHVDTADEPSGDPLSGAAGTPLTMVSVEHGGGRAAGAETAQVPAGTPTRESTTTPVATPGAGAAGKHAARGRTHTRRAVVLAACALGGLAAIGGVVGVRALLTGDPDGGDAEEPGIDLSELPVGEGSLPFFKAQDQQSERWGYLTAEGSWWLQPVLDHEPGPFAQGLAAVADNGDDALIGFVSAQGTWAIEPRFAEALPFSENLAAAREPDGSWGFIDTEGAWAVSPMFAAVGPFSQGRAAARMGEDGAWGYIDAGGAWMLAPSWIRACAFAEGVAAVEATDGGTWSLIDQAGTEVASGFAWSYARRASEGLLATQDAATGLWGFFDTAGATAVPPTFRACLSFSGGRAPAQDDASGLWGLIDTNGAWIVAPTFEEVGPTQSSLFAARDAESNLCGHLNADGSWAIAPEYLGAEFSDAE